MKATVQQKINEIEELLSTSEYLRAKRLADTVDPVSEQERAWLLIVRAEVCLYLGSSDLESLEKAIAILRPTENNLLYARAKFLFGWSLVRQGNPLEAVDYLLEARLCFRRYDKSRYLRRTIAVLAQVAFQRMDTVMVEAYTREIIDLCNPTDDREVIALYRANLAQSYILAGRLSEARSILNDFESELVNHSISSSINYHLSVGLLYSLQGQYAKAKASFRNIETDLDEHERKMLILAEYRGQLFLLDGDYESAEKALTSGLKKSLKLGSESALISQIKRLFGDLYVATEKYDLAHQFATEALAVAEKINERVEIAACYRIFGQIDNYRGNDNKAREWFKKAIDLFRVISSNYELAVTRYLAGASGLYRNGERHAILYLAREYFESEDVKPYIRKVDAELRGSKPLEHSPRKPVGNRNGHTIIAYSPVMKKLIEKAKSVAESNMTVLVTGETGTGKSLLARHIHNCSGRPGEFITVECTGIPEALLESELFGYEKGAFTGADALKQGRFELAQGGTLFLDEIGDIPASTQVKLLRALEDRRVMRLGSVKEISLDIRIIAATNCDLQQRMKENLFRTDLYYRLDNVLIDLPPLSERIEDIPAMVEHFLTNSGNGFKVNGNGPAIKRLGVLLAVPDYGGNIRELKNRVEKLLFMSDGDVDRMIESVINDGLLSGREWLLRILDQTGWNRREAARRLGVSEGTIRKRIRKFDLVPPKTNLA